VLSAGVTAVEAQEHLEPICNVLHFKTKHYFFTPELYDRKLKTVTKKKNAGPSWVSDQIVSSAPLLDEQQLLGVANPMSLEALYPIPNAELGHGGFGSVVLARTTSSHLVAIKQVQHETGRQKRKNFQEVRFLRYFRDHPNILQYHAAGIYDGELWIITEYLCGGTLSEAVQIHRFSEDEISFIAGNILKALVHLHAHQVMHRDLKSGNIILTVEGRVKLIDFGLCSDASNGELVHMVGSPFWMPPEMIWKKPHGLAADIWSFGVCLLECADGKRASDKPAIKAMFDNATKGLQDYVRSLKISESFSQFLLMCLQEEPEKRYKATELIKHPFICSTTFTTAQSSVLFSSIFKRKLKKMYAVI